jgi:hypothetical protein
MLGIRSDSFEKIADLIPEPLLNLAGILSLPLQERVRSGNLKQILKVITKIDNDSASSGGGNIIYIPKMRMEIQKDPNHKRRKGTAVIKFAEMQSMKPRHVEKRNFAKPIPRNVDVSAALARAIKKNETSVPAKHQDTDKPRPSYSGNTAGDLRNVARSQEKLFRKKLKTQPGYSNINMHEAY